MTRLEIKYVAIDKIIPYINNPRVNEHAVDVVAGSIAEFGFKNPIVIDQNNVIVAGHTRLLASRKLGLDEVPTIQVTDLTQQQIKAYRLADNKTAEFAEWDWEMLELEMEAIGDIDMELFGFREMEIEFHNSLNLNDDLSDYEPPDAEVEKTLICPHCQYQGKEKEFKQ